MFMQSVCRQSEVVHMNVHLVEKMFYGRMWTKKSAAPKTRPTLVWVAGMAAKPLPKKETLVSRREICCEDGECIFSAWEIHRK